MSILLMLLFKTYQAGFICENENRRAGSSGLSPSEYPPEGVFRRHSRGCLHQVSHPDQVIGGQAEGKHPTDAVHSTMSRLAQHPYRFQPAENLLEALAFPLANYISGMPRRATVDRAGPIAVVLRHMRRHITPTALTHKLLGVIALVSSNCDAMFSGEFFNHLNSGFPLGPSRRMGNPPVDSKPVAIFYRHMAQV